MNDTRPPVVTDWFLLTLCIATAMVIGWNLPAFWWK